MAKRKQKIIAALEEAVTEAEKKQSPYDLAKMRVVAAAKEWNDAIKEAHECADIRVFVQFSESNGASPGNLRVAIYRLDHAEIAYTVKFAEPEQPKMWQVLKTNSHYVAGKPNMQEST